MSLRHIQARIPIKDFEAIKKLVKKGSYMNRSDFFRVAIKNLLFMETIMVEVEK